MNKLTRRPLVFRLALALPLRYPQTGKLSYLEIPNYDIDI